MPPLSSTPSATPTPPAKRGGIGRWLLVLLLVPALIAGGWTWFSLNWAYSEGDRAGVLQKFSRKGWVCKTYEGEFAPQIWTFSVRDPEVAAKLTSVVGQRVQLHYTEHVGVPTNCFGETAYFIEKVVPLGEVQAAQ
jgi:hypothetical protein